MNYELKYEIKYIIEMLNYLNMENFFDFRNRINF